MVRHWLKVNVLCAKYAIHKWTVYHWIKNGKIQAVRRGGIWLVYDPGFIDVTVKDPEYLPLMRGVEVCRILKISPRRLRQLVVAGHIGCEKIGRNRKFSVQDLRKYLAYRKAREGFANGDSRVPVGTAQDAREAVISWVEEKLSE